MLVLPPAVAALLGGRPVPPTLTERILFFDGLARIEAEAHRRAKALRLAKLAAAHAHRHNVFRHEAARLRRLQQHLRPAVVRPAARPLPPPASFRPSVTRPPPPPRATPSSLFQPGVYGPSEGSGEPPSVQDAPDEMAPSTPDEQANATASVNADASVAASGSGWGLGTWLLIGGGVFLGYKLLKGKKKGSASHAAAA